MYISYHKLRESAEAVIVNPVTLCTAVNQANILIKSVSADMLGSFSNTSNGVIKEEV